MNQFATSHATGQSDNDLEREIHHLAGRLHRRFPTLPQDDIVLAVSSEYRRMGPVRVRDFLPVLVERRVRSRLQDVATAR